MSQPMSERQPMLAVPSRPCSRHARLLYPSSAHPPPHSPPPLTPPTCMPCTPIGPIGPRGPAGPGIPAGNHTQRRPTPPPPATHGGASDRDLGGTAMHTRHAPATAVSLAAPVRGSRGAQGGMGMRQQRSAGRHGHEAAEERRAPWAGRRPTTARGTVPPGHPRPWLPHTA